MKGQNRKLTDAQESVVCREYQQGFSLRNLAGRFGMTAMGISNVLRRHGVPRRRSGAQLKKHRRS